MASARTAGIEEQTLAVARQAIETLIDALAHV